MEKTDRWPKDGESALHTGWDATMLSTRLSLEEGWGVNVCDPEHEDLKPNQRRSKGGTRDFASFRAMAAAAKKWVKGGNSVYIERLKEDGGVVYRVEFEEVVTLDMDVALDASDVEQERQQAGISR